MMSCFAKPSRHRSRSGAILICVLACMVVVSGMMIAFTQATLSARREANYRLQIQQTQLLMDAGIQRASSQLAQSDDYTGETWSPSAALDRFDGAKVKIEVSPNPKDKASLWVLVTASLNPDSPIRTTRSHRFQVPLP